MHVPSEQALFGLVRPCPECPKQSQDFSIERASLETNQKASCLIQEIPRADSCWMRKLGFSRYHEKHVLLLEVEKGSRAEALERLSPGPHALFPGCVFLSWRSNHCAEY